jgi:hypothetical protein
MTLSVNQVLLRLLHSLQLKGCDDDFVSSQPFLMYYRLITDYIKLAKYNKKQYA